MAVPWGAGAGAPLAVGAAGLWAWRPAGQDSCPLPPAAAPGSHGAGEGRVTTHAPPPVERCPFAGKLLCHFVPRGLELGPGAK